MLLIRSAGHCQSRLAKHLRHSLGCYASARFFFVHGTIQLALWSVLLCPTALAPWIIRTRYGPQPEEKAACAIPGPTGIDCPIRNDGHPQPTWPDSADQRPPRTHTAPGSVTEGPQRLPPGAGARVARLFVQCSWLTEVTGPLLLNTVE